MRVSHGLFLLASLFLLPQAAPAQQTAADSAQVLLDAARLLRLQGKDRVAGEILRHIQARYPGTPAALAAQEQEQSLPAPAITGMGRTGFFIYNTLYGGFLGVAIPAAFGSDDGEAYGAGLLIGAPLGFFASRAYAKHKNLTAGQAGVVDFSSFWGTWQGFGWRAVFEIGDTETCDDFDNCYIESSDKAPWAAGVIGGLTGLGVGLLAAGKPISSSTSTMIFNSALWGTWYGIALGILAGWEDDQLLSSALIGGDIGVLLAIPASMAWKPAPARVRIATAGGLAGGLAGAGIVLLADISDDKGAVAAIAAGTTVGLVVGAMLGKDAGHGTEEAALWDPALINVKDGVRLGLPMPTPTVIPVNRAKGRATVPGLRISLLNAEF
jgi:hypothetical protein